MAKDMTVADGASVSSLWPEKKVGDTVKLKDFFWYGGELYRCNQPELTITAGQEPDKNLPALYGHVSVAPDGILIWDADDLTGAPDIYNEGVRVHHHGADGPCTPPSATATPASRVPTSGGCWPSSGGRTSLSSLNGFTVFDLVSNAI